MDKQLKLRIVKKYIELYKLTEALSLLQEFINAGDTSNEVFYLMGVGKENKNG